MLDKYNLHLMQCCWNPLIQSLVRSSSSSSGLLARALFVVNLIGVFLFGCRSQAAAVPAPTVQPHTATSVLEQPITGTAVSVPITWTPYSIDEETATAVNEQPIATPTRTEPVLPVVTPTPTASDEASPITTSAAPLPPTPVPEPTALPSLEGPNLLGNGSFEHGWYHPNGIPELQVPVQWQLLYQVGFNQLDPEPFNQFVRPESRVINGDFLPAGEHSLFIWDGEYTTKIFKRQGSLSFQMLTDIYLLPGSYTFEINVFPDMIVGYTELGDKVWAPDPLSGELRFIIGDVRDDWQLPAFGEKNTFQRSFEIEAVGFSQIGVAFRGRWAILNNGWFLDDWSLMRIQDGTG